MNPDQPASSEAGGTGYPRDIPPLWLCVAFGAEVALHYGAPMARWLYPPWTLVGIAVNVLGLALMAGAAGLFRRLGTGVRPFTDATTLVATGPFRFTRNPMYLGMVLMLVGGALALGTASPWLVPPAFGLLMDRRFIAAEERFLTGRFGDSYREYCRRVRRWL